MKFRRATILLLSNATIAVYKHWLSILRTKPCMLRQPTVQPCLARASLSSIAGLASVPTLL